jgi:glycine cleavage system H protein
VEVYLNSMRIGKYEFKEDLIYSEEHLWISIKENIARIGVDSFLVDKLKEIINIELTYIDNEVEVLDTLATIFFDSDSLEIESPFSGKIINLNEDLEYDPDLLIDSNYEDGWLVEIELENNNEIKKLLSSRKLLSGEQAEEWFRSEIEKE